MYKLMCGKRGGAHLEGGGVCADAPTARLSSVQMVASEERMGLGGDLICVRRHTRTCRKGMRNEELQ